MKLGEYLQWAIRQPWAWGLDSAGLDCCTFANTWCQAQAWGSPMAAIGIQYDSELSALRRIREGGGLLALWSQGMAAIDARAVGDMRAGDIGVIRRPTPCGTDEAAAIWTGERWVSLGLRGLDFGPAEALAVWRG